MGIPAVRCPEFPADLTWLNSSRPLTVQRDLRGRVAVLDFWTYCCINCMHTLPVLKRIEERFAGRPVAVVGVHSAKFLTEKDPENIRRAMRRYGVTHPVVVDSDHDVWQRFAVRSWPTLVLVDASGYVRETLPGEADEESLAAKLEALLEEGRAKGTLADGPLDVAPEEEADTTFLRFPGKVLLAGGRLFVADSGHNRIVIAGLDGRVQGIVGEGGAGAHDGPAGHASFHNPQGLEVIDGTLYVADTGNHMIRAVDLETRMVTTVAGTGRKGRSVIDGDPADPRRLALRSPWALASVDRYLFIAMAGSHQIWAMDTQAGRLGPWAGSGHEGHVDGPVREAAFAQPSGLARAGRLMLVADSEVSSVRAIDMTKGHVGTIVGRGLFEFGDRDGTTDEAMLQHPLDVAVDAGGIFVADSYNNKVKVLVMETGEVRTLFGDGRREVLDEPGGIAVQGSRLYIADTNNHRILKGEPATRLLGEFVLEAGRK